MIKFAKIILIFILLLPFSGYAWEIEEEEILLRPSRPYVEHIFLEQESIIAFFEIKNIDEYKKLIPSIFSMPEKPLCRMIMNNFYKMESAPQIWNIKFGDCSIEYPDDPNNYLHCLGMGRFITGYWLDQKYRYKIQYKEEKIEGDKERLNRRQFKSTIL